MKNIKEFIYINLINLFIVIISILANFSGTLKLPTYVILIITYTIFLLSKDEVEIIKYQISYAVIVSVIVDNIFAFTKLQMPLELKYFIDFISLIILFKIILNFKKYRTIIKDRILIIIGACVIINIALLFNDTYRLYDFFNGIRMYFRFVPIYIVLSCRSFNFKNMYYKYYIINIMLIFFGVIINLPVDSRNGIFGIVGPSYIFLSILVAINTIKYLKKGIKISTYIATILLTMVILVLQENKAIMLILPIAIFILIMIDKGYVIRKNIIIVSIIISLIVGVRLLTTLFPNFSSMYNVNTMNTAVENYIYGNSNPAFVMGRFQALSYMEKVELDSPIDKLFGKGLGSALPAENWYYSGDMLSKGRKVIDFKPSFIYEKYGANFGYHLSSYVILYLENGILGISTVIIILIIMFRRSFIIMKKCDLTSKKAIGAIGIITLIIVLFPLYYSSILQSRLFEFLLFVIMGIVTNQYRRTNLIDKRKD